MSNTEERCKNCGHYEDWHPYIQAERRGCDWFGCDCLKYEAKP